MDLPSCRIFEGLFDMHGMMFRDTGCLDSYVPESKDGLIFDTGSLILYDSLCAGDSSLVLAEPSPRCLV